jgi:hypothetical protein
VLHSLDLRDLDEVRRRVVLPVVQSLVRPDELEEVVVELEHEMLPPRRIREALRSMDSPAPGAAGVFGFIGAEGDEPEPWERGPGLELRIAFKARGESVGLPRRWFVGEGGAALRDPDYFAADVYDSLRDELTESRFAWGQLRDGDYELLGPRADSAPDGT